MCYMFIYINNGVLNNGVCNIDIVFDSNGVYNNNNVANNIIFNDYI